MATADVLHDQHLFEQEYDKTVRADIEQFRKFAQGYLDGKVTEDEFRNQRLRRGVYGQRQDGVQMIRTKIPGGLLTASQMRTLADVADQVGGGKGHLTTRQNMQYHFVPLAQVPDALHLLADSRLTTREACYNTVRNVTACPLAGLLPEEPFDVRPYAQQIALAFLHKELTDSLPRKFKIALSACKEDCISTVINDVGLRAVVRDGVNGFRMTVAGGLGALPTEGQILHEFVPADEVVRRVEAVIRIFNMHGNRNNKNKARLKFVMRERGMEWLSAAIEEQYQDILQNGGVDIPEVVPESFGGFRSTKPDFGSGEMLPLFDPTPEYQAWKETNVREQRDAGHSIVTILTPQGNLTAGQMREIAKLSEDAGDANVRVSMSQNLSIAYVPVGALPRVYGKLAEIGLAGARVDEISDVVTCPGAYSCNLGITKTMGLGDALSQTVAKYDDPDVRALKIRASGCPNACGQHWVGDLGFYGNARKIEGREVPYYLMMLGGTDREFGMAVGSLPAKSAPIATERILDHYVSNKQDGEAFRDYVKRFKIQVFKEMTKDLFKPTELSEDMYKDWGDSEDYSLQLGRGECAA